MSRDAILREREGSPRWRRLPAIALSVLLIAFFVKVSREFSLGYSQTIAAGQAQTIIPALRAYVAEFGGPPTGDHAAMMRALRGGNPKQLVLFAVDARELNAQGEFPDPWGRPYRIDVSDPKLPKVYSLGKNGVDEGGAVGSDDVVSWR